jgi:ACS family hexuronate transporter-like MFS transporter
MPEVKKFSNYRWTVCALIFFATTVNYLDRQIIGILKPLLDSELGIGEKDYAHIIMAFQLLYAVGMFFAGRLIDKFGTKIGYGVSVILWSIAAMGHALAKGVLGFGIWRGFLGISEAGNFPAANKAIAEWFPKKERALAFGIMNSGTNVGAILAPLAIPAMLIAWGWQVAFIVTGSIGFIWVILWFIFYEVPEKHKKVSASELAYINSDVDEQNETKEKVPWMKLFKLRQTWLFFIGKGLTDPIWWFYLFWIPGWLSTVRGAGLSVSSFGLPLAFIYTMTTIGSIGGGWVSGYMITKGMSPYKSRKVTMLIFALMVVPIIFAQSKGVSTWGAVCLIALAASAHQAWSTNLFTTVSDAFPKKVVSSITGIGGLAGAVGGAFISYLAGGILQHFKDLGNIETGYVVMFSIAGSAYLLAWLIMTVFAPKNNKVVLD